MRCMVCGAEMSLMNVAQDETMSVSGFAHHTYMCSVCYDIERRLVFNKRPKERDTLPTPLVTAPPIAPASAAQNQGAADHGVLWRLLAKIHR
jgi:hypothetical protein